MASSKYRSNTFIKTEPTVEVNREPEPILSPNPWIYTKKWCRRCPPTKLMHNKINTAVPLSSRLVPEFKSPSPCKERLALRAPFRSLKMYVVCGTSAFAPNQKHNDTCFTLRDEREAASEKIHSSAFLSNVWLKNNALLWFTSFTSAAKNTSEYTAVCL